MQKIIHYCWFGDKPLSKVAKKCIASWKKFLPDYKIMLWSEENVNFNECEFIKGAYEHKKWAFVADYVRAKALKEYGGIYFDTDMEITKNIDCLINDEKTNTFLGLEDSGYVAVGVWYEKESNAYLSTELVNKYRNIKKFNVDKMTEFTIPKLISGILNKKKLKYSSNDIQYLDDKITIYPREYFYPYSYYWDEKIVTDNTYMIHYYDASWLRKKERIKVYLIRHVGEKYTYAIINRIIKARIIAVKCLKPIAFPYLIYRRYKRKNAKIDKLYKEKIVAVIKNIEYFRGKKYITFYNSDWKGVSSSTKELFENLVALPEIYRKRDAKLIAKTIENCKINQIVFSSFAIGWKEVAIYLKKCNSNIKIKTFWHGSHSQILDEYGWNRNKEIIKLHKANIINIMGTCKKSLLMFYKNQKFNAKFITNKVQLEYKKSKNSTQAQDNEIVKLGLYAAKCTDWRKNMYSQMAAASLIKNAVLDIVPLDSTAKHFAKLLKLKITGEGKNISRLDLIDRMSKNDVNLYVTFSECSPMVPLESLEANVPCIIGNNCHYFKNSKLENYLIVNNEENILQIKEKIELAKQDRKNIIEGYKEYKKANAIECNQEKKDFLEE